MLRCRDLERGLQALELDDDGHPLSPSITVDCDDATELRADGLMVAADILRRCRAVVILVARESRIPQELLLAADIAFACSALPGQRILEVLDPDAGAADCAARIAAAPTAALTLAWLLRYRDALDVPAALAAESAAYSALLGGSDFSQWLRTRPAPRPRDPAERVLLARDGDVLRVTLDRPLRRNAVDTHMRHALLEALHLAVLDPHLQVLIDASGPSFSAGGDLDEFGTMRDLGLAHLIRVAASVGQVLHDLRERVTVRVHGACIGAGIELPAFAGAVLASPDAHFQLPEVGLGLIPGAGGTASIPLRIGRWRTAWLGITGERIDAQTALRWGLVDAIV